MLAAGGTFALALMAIATACGDDEGNEPSSSDSPTTTEPQTPATTLSPEEEVEAAYLAYWEMLERLSSDPDPDDPEIEHRASGKARGEVIDGLTTLIALGRIAHSGPEYHHDVMSIDVSGDKAVVRDCAVDDSTIVDASSDERISGGELTTGLIKGTLVLHDGDWKVSDVDTVETWRGIYSCHD